MDSGPLPSLPPGTIAGITQVWRNDVASVAALAWMVYDIILTYPQEVQYIWRAPWSSAKLLFFASRYYGLLNSIFQTAVLLSDSVSPEFCEGFKWFLSFGGEILFVAIVNLLILLRINALYKNRRSLLVFLIISYFVEIAAQIAVTYLTINDIHSVSKSQLPVRGCLYTVPTTHVNLYAWVPALLLSALYFILALWKFIVFLRDESETFGFSFMRSARTPLSTVPIMKMFVRDGTVWFVVLFVVVLLNTLFTTLAKTALAQVAVPWLLATYTIAGSRMILNLRSPHKTSSQTLVASDIEMRPRRTPALVYKAPDDDDPDSQGSWSVFSHRGGVDSTLSA